MTRSILSAVFFASMALVSITPAATAKASQSSKSAKQILFVCTGNFYRSRFAEVLFNEKARETNSSWTAISRGLALVSWQHGISPFAVRELRRRDVPAELCKGTPRALRQTDLEDSDYIVLMDEREHRPMFEKQFPQFDENKIHYWHIPDGSGNCAQACKLMSKNINELLQTLPH